MKILRYFPLLPFLFLSVFSGPLQKEYRNTESKIDDRNDFFPEKTTFTRSLVDDLNGNVIEYPQKEFILYCKEDSYADKNRDYLISLAHSSINRIKSVLNIDHLTEGFYLVMVDSRKEMERMVGRKVKALASGRNNTGIFVYNSNIRPYFKHELFHLIAFNEWGPPQSRLLDEGGAVYSDNECLHYIDPISTINKFLFEKNKWFDINDLIHNFSEKAQENDLIAYLQAGFIFRHLFEKYGRDKMKKLWLNGFDYFENIYGFNLTDLKQKIYGELETIQFKKVDWDELMEKGCG